MVLISDPPKNLSLYLDFEWCGCTIYLKTEIIEGKGLFRADNDSGF